ncbi:SLIT-ROBO Rho GTPase-activating protein 1-like isoform X3 [Trichogramma pretiosum]|uniref:SLIT-ROBO Rho GTPase-activating protein 1-like isoform X3 n=1 Tax=Trichogramma pretiosum TaxID=7493 RepID=UPI0006C95EA7|nr:SLIT-ROBO Rho GTPase-activating protein 1-like isoform X3 [Trichogramma pretiosum]
MFKFGGHKHSEFDSEIKDIRLQLNEQLRCLDVRMEAQVALVAELQDFFRKRSELELDYSKSLDKMAKGIQMRHKEQKQKREEWPLFSSYSCWQQLINETKNLSRDHAALSEVYSTHLVARLNQVMEDVQRIYKRCREIGYETHEEILRVLHELHTTMKTYQAYQAESRQAETKLRGVEAQRSKYEVTSVPPEKLARSKKYRVLEKEVNKRKIKYTEARLKALKARNEYMLCLEASNTTIHKYFVEDLSDLIDCMDFGFHNCVARALMMHCSAEEGRQRSLQAGVEQLAAQVSALDSRADKQRFLEAHHAAFMIPKKFEFQAGRSEVAGSVTAQAAAKLAALDNNEANNSAASAAANLIGAEPELQKLLRSEMEQRLGQLQTRVTTLRTESEEVWKTLETAEASLLEMLTAKDYDCSKYFGENGLPSSRPPETAQIKLRADRHETEEFYLSKFREYLLGTSRIARLDAKQDYIRRILMQASDSGQASPSLSAGAAASAASAAAANAQKQARRKRIGRLQLNARQPKLFGGSLEEYLESTNQEIPLIVRSCVRVINLYGLHHQGIFRVSGSQVEINNFREWFERGEDPLADVTDASDINSVAGVLKLYLRELREPLFPIIYFEQLMELAQLDSKHEFVSRMRQLVSSLPRPVIIVMRYLFAFLNHLSEFSDENMMDPYNLAICFGPTLVPVPEDKDQVQYQNQVNELIKNIITLYEDIFPDDIGGIQYEKYISREPEDVDVGDSPTDQVQEDLDSEVYPSEDESENLEATAQFDFKARSERELSFKKGDTLTLYAQVSNDWWKGALAGKDGLIPDKYIMLKIKDEERDKDLKSSSSEESMRRRASSSADSVLSSNNSPLMGPSNNTNVWPSTAIAAACDAAISANMTQSNSSSSSSIVPPVVTNVSACVSTSSQAIISRENPVEQCESIDDTEGNVDIGSYLSNGLSLGLGLTKAAAFHEITTGPRAARPPSLERDSMSNGLSNTTPGAAESRDELDESSSSSHQEQQIAVPQQFADEVSSSSSSSASSSLTSTPLQQRAAARKYPWKSQSMGEQQQRQQLRQDDLSADEQNSFSANRELWQRRAASQGQLLPPVPGPKPQTPRATPDLRELRQKHAPDLVLDLPPSAQEAKPVPGAAEEIPDESNNEGEAEPINQAALQPTVNCSIPPSSGPESPDMSTAAERFAKQNQCTLKKRPQTQGEVAQVVQQQMVAVPASISDQNEVAPPQPIVRSASSSQITPMIAAKFAELHLTGGSQLPAGLPLPPGCKPQMKIKPLVLRKPVLPPHVQPSPELGGRKVDNNKQPEQPAN